MAASRHGQSRFLGGTFMREQTPVGNKYTVELCGNVLYQRWASGAVVTEEDARAVMAKVSALCSSRPRPMVVDISRMGVLEHKARTVFAGAWPLTRVAVVGASPVDRVIVDFYVARHAPVCPTKFFTSFSDAMTWLGITSGQTMNLQRLSRAGEATNHSVRDQSRDARDADRMLNVLLERTEKVISETQAVTTGWPLFSVEAKLTERLHSVLPGVRFIEKDVRAWAARISS
ncbi:hypothetical protein QFZ40_001084 [Arthrobacter pascens]|nr:hypothetical protein [Arthrobacter pascens]